MKDLIQNLALVENDSVRILSELVSGLKKIKVGGEAVARRADGRSALKTTAPRTKTRTPAQDAQRKRWGIPDKKPRMAKSGRPGEKMVFGKWVKTNESDDDTPGLTEAAGRVDSYRWSGSTGKRVPTGDGMWAFTTDLKFHDLNDKEHVVTANGKYSDAKKQALAWLKQKKPNDSAPLLYLLP